MKNVLNYSSGLLYEAYLGTFGGDASVPYAKTGGYLQRLLDHEDGIGQIKDAGRRVTRIREILIARTRIFLREYPAHAADLQKQIGKLQQALTGHQLSQIRETCHGIVLPPSESDLGFDW